MDEDDAKSLALETATRKHGFCAEVCRDSGVQGHLNNQMERLITTTIAGHSTAATIGVSAQTAD